MTSFGADGYNWPIKAGAFVDFCALIDSLGNSFSRNWCHKFILCFFFLLLDYYGSLGSSSSSLAIVFCVSESLGMKGFNFVVSNGTKNFFYGSISGPSI